METLGSIALAVWITLTGFLGIHTEPQSGALSVLTASQGGTGIGSATAGDVGKVLSVSSNSPFTYTLSSAGAGDVIGGSSLGTGLNIFDTKSSGILRFNTIAAGTNISISTSSNNNTLVISGVAATSPYEIATTSNIAVPELAYFTQTGGRTTLGSVATTTATLSSAFSYSGTLGKLVGGADGTLSLASHVIFPGSYFAATGTTTNATSTNLGVSLITAIGSDGIDLHSSNGTSVLQLGSGGGSNASFFGGVNIDGTTRLATSLTGLAYTTSGTVSAVTNGSGGQVLAMSGGVPTFVATTTAGTGLTYSGGAFNVNTSQNIATLSNLTTNGLVTTSGGNGTLGVTANGTAGFVLAMSGGVPTWVSTSTINNGVTSLGVTGSSLTGALLLATSSTAYNGLTASTTITCATLTCTFANTLAGVLGVAGGGTGATSLTGLISGNGTGAFTATANGTNGQVLAMSSGVPTWVATTTLSTITGTLAVGKGGTGLTTFGGTNTVLFTTAADTLSSASTFVYNSAAATHGIGTSTPRWALTVSSSTAPQLTLTDASIGNAPFNFRAQNTSLFIGTSSPTTFATTTISMLTLDSSTGSTTAFKLDKSGTATSTFAGGIYLTSGCFSINGTCVGSGAGTPGGSGTEVQYRSGASTFGAITNSAYTSQGVGNGYLGLGTSTPKWTLQLATSTQPQLVLSDTTNLQAPWYFRSISGAFYMGTTSTSTFATTTTPVFSLDTNGAASFTSSITSLISLTAPIHYGGTAAGSTLTLRPTSGAGVGADAIIFGLGNNGANEVGRMTGLGYFGLGTTTPKWLLQIASSTRAQLTLSDASRTSNHYSFRAINNWLYLSTSSPTTFASTTNPVFSITPGGQVSVYAIQPATSTTMTLDWEQTPNQVEYRIGGAATTITLINATTSRMWGSTKRVYVCNPSGTAGALTWAGVEWIGSSPAQTTTADQCDLYSFNVTRATSTSAYKVAGAQSAGLQ